jgi:hypothetical protein
MDSREKIRILAYVRRLPAVRPSAFGPRMAGTIAAVSIRPMMADNRGAKPGRHAVRGPMQPMDIPTADDLGRLDGIL